MAGILALFEARYVDWRGVPHAVHAFGVTAAGLIHFEASGLAQTSGLGYRHADYAA